MVNKKIFKLSNPIYIQLQEIVLSYQRIDHHTQIFSLPIHTRIQLCTYFQQLHLSIYILILLKETVLSYQRIDHHTQNFCLLIHEHIQLQTYFQLLDVYRQYI